MNGRRNNGPIGRPRRRQITPPIQRSGKRPSYRLKPAATNKRTMSHRVLHIVGRLSVAACLIAAPVSPVIPLALAQATDAKPSDQQAPAGQDTGPAAQQVD